MIEYLSLTYNIFVHKHNKPVKLKPTETSAENVVIKFPLLPMMLPLAVIVKLCKPMAKVVSGLMAWILPLLKTAKQAEIYGEIKIIWSRNHL